MGYSIIFTSYVSYNLLNWNLIYIYIYLKRKVLGINSLMTMAQPAMVVNVPKSSIAMLRVIYYHQFAGFFTVKFCPVGRTTVTSLGITPSGLDNLAKMKTILTP